MSISALVELRSHLHFIIYKMHELQTMDSNAREKRIQVLEITAVCRDLAGENVWEWFFACEFGTCMPSHVEIWTVSSSKISIEFF